MKKIRFDDCVCKTQLIDHDRIRDKLLNSITNDSHVENIDRGGYYGDKVSKCDMAKIRDLNRPWVKKLVPHLTISLNEMFSSLGYTGYSLVDIWYHQYNEGDMYGWHIHGLQYSGIYYLEFSKECGRTSMCSPYNLKSRNIDAKEGDVIIFPSHFIHRALPNKRERKTVISFNFNLDSSNLDWKRIR